jgi:hypothetical protein
MINDVTVIAIVTIFQALRNVCRAQSKVFEAGHIVCMFLNVSMAYI